MVGLSVKQTSCQTPMANNGPNENVQSLDEDQKKIGIAEHFDQLRVNVKLVG